MANNPFLDGVTIGGTTYDLKDPNLTDEVINLKSALQEYRDVFPLSVFNPSNATIYLVDGYDFNVSFENANRVSTTPVYVPSGKRLLVTASGFGKYGYSYSTNGKTVAGGKNLGVGNNLVQIFQGPIYFRLIFANATDTTPISVDSVTINAMNAFDHFDERLDALTELPGENLISVNQFTVTGNSVTYVTDTTNNTITVTNSTNGRYHNLRTSKSFISNNLKVGKTYRLHVRAKVDSGNPDLKVGVYGIQESADNIAKMFDINDLGEGFIDFTVDQYMNSIALFVTFNSGSKESVVTFSDIWLKEYNLTGIDFEAREEIAELAGNNALQVISELSGVGVKKPANTSDSGSLAIVSGYTTGVYLIDGYNTVCVERPISTSVIFTLSNTLYTLSDIPVRNLDGMNVTGTKLIYQNIKKYKYLYINVEVPDSSSYYVKVTCPFTEIVNSLQGNVNQLLDNVDTFDNIGSNIVCTYKKMYVAKDGAKLKFSSDSMNTWSKELDVGEIGTIKTYHLFDNGCIALFTHNKAYYSEDWNTLNEASVYESDGVTAYSPSTYDNFSVTKEYTDRKYVGTQDLYVFGNYGITDENNTRRIIWASLDNGHSYKVIYEFNITGAYSIRHVHTVVYNPNFDKFLCLTGDSASQSHVIEFEYSENNGFNSFRSLGDGSNYKWAGIAWYGEYVYYCYDNSPGKLMCCKYAEIHDNSKHQTILDNLPNDCIGLFIGDRGDMLVTLSNYRSGTTNSPFSGYVDALNMYYSQDREHFVAIRGETPTGTNGIYYGFFGANGDGRLVSGWFRSSITLDNWDKLPSVDLAYYVKKAGYSKAFTPYNPSYEITPVLQIECEDVSVAVGETKALNVIVYPYNATVSTWSIINYDSSYLSVSNNSITGVASGETQITIRSNSNYEVTKTVNITIS